MIAKDGAALELEAKQKLKEASAERLHNMVSEQEAKQEAVTAPDGRFDVTSLQQQLGRTMKGIEVQRRLKMLNPFLYFERSHSFPDRDNVMLLERDDKRYLFSMENGLCPERSVKDGHGVCIRKGWRTVLVQLIKDRQITVPGAERLFGINNGGDTPNWHKDLS